MPGTTKAVSSNLTGPVFFFKLEILLFKQNYRLIICLLGLSTYFCFLLAITNSSFLCFDLPLLFVTLQNLTSYMFFFMPFFRIKILFCPNDFGLYFIGLVALCCVV